MAQELIAAENKPGPYRGRRNNHGRASIKAGAFEAEVEVDISSRGLLAVGGLVSLILLSVVPIIVVATRRAPRRPWR